jgi:hypothetical protein
MHGETLVFAQVMIVIVSSVASLVGIGLGARVLWRMGSQTRPTPVAAGDDARMQRLEAAVDSIAIEVERISEGQRFSVALLSDRFPGRQGDGQRVNTPH